MQHPGISQRTRSGRVRNPRRPAAPVGMMVLTALAVGTGRTSACYTAPRFTVRLWQADRGEGIPRSHAYAGRSDGWHGCNRRQDSSRRCTARGWESGWRAWTQLAHGHYQRAHSVEAADVQAHRWPGGDTSGIDAVIPSRDPGRGRGMGRSRQQIRARRGESGRRPRRAVAGTDLAAASRPAGPGRVHDTWAAGSGRQRISLSRIP